jgi:hypothetical protein
LSLLHLRLSGLFKAAARSHTSLVSEVETIGRNKQP